MKRTITLFLCILAFNTVHVAADVGVGIILGSPTGLSALFGNRVALAAAWDLQSERMHVHGDVWLLRQRLVDPVDWYLGVGGKAQIKSGNGDDVRVGVRVPLGVQWYAFPRLELFGEIVPGMRLVPSTSFDLDAGIGIRFHF
ncbi:MAG: hypothetical protein EA427_10030 [Spirochaetaceae bacterium]|nr:MAG: hypothetical protein EA427_10030 [Spirochaetaceae bacterium]